jgi:Rieske Fe-S protein
MHSRTRTRVAWQRHIMSCEQDAPTRTLSHFFHEDRGSRADSSTSGVAAYGNLERRKLSRGPYGPELFTAMTAICTHETCTITGFESQEFVCHCHGSRFNTNGAVVLGPAVSSPQQFPTQCVNSALTIT